MSKSTPSLLALLGLVAVAGYQNRDKISEMLADVPKGSRSAPNPAQQSAEQHDGGLLSEIGRVFGAGSAGGTLASGLSDLVDRFRNSGRAAPADSWVSDGPNLPVDAADMEASLGSETLDELARKTGLPRSELLQRLHTALPEVVNRFTPKGRLPTEHEAREMR